jgi:hypothetical protein
MEQYLTQLIKILQQPSIPDMYIQIEIRRDATLSLDNLIDINPQLTARCVSQGLVDALK